MADLNSPTIKPPSQAQLLVEDEAQSPAVPGATGGAQTGQFNMSITGGPASVTDALGLDAPTGAASTGAADSGPYIHPGAPGVPTAQAPGAAPAGSLDQNLEGFAQDALSAPSRYDMDLVQQGLGVINADIADSTRESRNQLDEYSSSRGLVGSSVEAANMRQMLMDQEREKLRRSFNLGQDMAQTYSQDRAAAGQMGLATGDYLRRGGQWEQEFGLAQDRQALDAEIRRRALDLEAQGMSSDMALRWATLDAEREFQDRSLSQQDQLARLGYKTSTFDSLARLASATGQPDLMNSIPAWLREELLGSGSTWGDGSGGTTNPGGGYTSDGTELPTTADGGGVVDPGIGDVVGGAGPSVYPPRSEDGTLPPWILEQLQMGMLG